MAFDIDNFKEVGGDENFSTGGQVYSQHSDTDSLATMMASGYLDDLDGTINSGDNMILSGTDGSQLVRIINTAGVITVTSVASSGTESLAAAGALDPAVAVSLVTLTGTEAVTLADGTFPGQTKYIYSAATATGWVLTPATFLQGTTLTFTTIEAGATLVWSGTGGWVMIGIESGVALA